MKIVLDRGSCVRIDNIAVEVSITTFLKKHSSISRYYHTRATYDFLHIILLTSIEKRNLLFGKAVYSESIIN